MAKLKRKTTQDKARAKTDKQLEQMERNIGRVYKEHPALIAIEKKYAAYMESVKKQTKKEYIEYQQETDIDTKAKLKKIYADKVDSLTRKSKEYNKIVREFVSILSQANQEAIEVANSGMRQIYVENYNEIAEECKKAGIEVNG